MGGALKTTAGGSGTLWEGKVECHWRSREEEKEALLVEVRCSTLPSSPAASLPA